MVLSTINRSGHNGKIGCKDWFRQVLPMCDQILGRWPVTSRVNPSFWKHATVDEFEYRTEMQARCGDQRRGKKQLLQFGRHAISLTPASLKTPRRKGFKYSRYRISPTTSSLCVFASLRAPLFVYPRHTDDLILSRPVNLL